MLPADDDVGVAVILAVDCVHDGFFRAAIKHLDVQSEQHDSIRHALAARAPEFGVAVAFAQATLTDERFVSLHPDFRTDVVALCLADQRVEDGASIFAFADERFQAVDQCVLVSPVKRVPRLKSDDRVPALFGDESSRFARGEDVLTEVRILRLRQGSNRSANQVRLVGVTFQHHVGARVIRPFGQVNALQVSLLVPLVDVVQVERPNDVSFRAGQCDALSSGEGGCDLGCHGKRDGNRPGVESTV